MMHSYVVFLTIICLVIDFKGKWLTFSFRLIRILHYSQTYLMVKKTSFYSSNLIRLIEMRKNKRIIWMITLLKTFFPDNPLEELRDMISIHRRTEENFFNEKSKDVLLKSMAWTEDLHNYIEYILNLSMNMKRQVWKSFVVHKLKTIFFYLFRICRYNLRLIPSTFKSIEGEQHMTDYILPFQMKLLKKSVRGPNKKQPISHWTLVRLVHRSHIKIWRRDSLVCHFSHKYLAE